MTARRIAPPAALALLAVAAGCGGHGADPNPPPAAAKGPAVRVVAATPARTVPLERVQTAAIDVPFPDWMAWAGGSLFVKRDDGQVTRVDPATNRVTGRLRIEQVGAHHCQGLGAGGGAVWSCNEANVVRIDPSRMKVTATLPVRKIFDQWRMVAAAGRLWILTRDGNPNQLVGIDLATNRVTSRVALPVRCADMGPARRLIWIICPSDRVLAFDPAHQKIRGTVRLRTPTNTAGTDTDGWIGTADGLVRVDAATLRPVARFAGLHPGKEGDLAADGDTVWVRSRDGFLHRIDARRNAVVARVVPPHPFSGGSVSVRGGSVWVTAYDDDVLFRLRSMER